MARKYSGNLGSGNASKSDLVSLRGSLTLVEKSIDLKLDLPKFVPVQNTGQQRYATYTAPELTWQSHNIGEFELSPDSGFLTFNIKEMQQLRSDEDVFIKGIELTKL
ncbi:hypothetical protein [Paraglaciecola hydrolytica]|uniref:Uncharacterized protein n=1 Tax=Paraglaciecola hydrolytica TaxID=1799789 RepID=A0A148KM50_9ALTE|nr:hypothetical protein [Paraglaciecola hydrolytica]KXI27339.1 hypothetical protein AX660_21700 [Paraglaciecola hydrolytica]